MAHSPTTRRRKKANRAPFLLLLGSLLILLAGLGYPILWQIITSFQHFGLEQQFGAPPTFAGLENYARIFTDDRLWTVVGRSLAFCFVNAFATVFIGLMVALIMRAVHGGVRIVIQIALLLAWAMPMVAAVTVFRWLFDYRTGIVNWLLTSLGLSGFDNYAWLSHALTFYFVASLIIIWMSVPFVALSLYAGLTQISTDVIEAAEIDGASRTQQLRYILLPSFCCFSSSGTCEYSPRSASSKTRGRPYRTRTCSETSSTNLAWVATISQEHPQFPSSCLA